MLGGGRLILLLNLVTKDSSKNFGLGLAKILESFLFSFSQLITWSFASRGYPQSLDWKSSS